jgi:hypothetical protein
VLADCNTPLPSAGGETGGQSTLLSAVRLAPVPAAAAVAAGPVKLGASRLCALLLLLPDWLVLGLELGVTLTAG